MDTKIARTPVGHSVRPSSVGKPGPKAGSKTGEVEKFIENFCTPGGEIEEILLKNHEAWSENERTQVMHRVKDLSRDPVQAQEIDDRVRAWFAHYYGDGPAEHDVTGKMVPPRPRRTIPLAPDIARTPDGEPVEDAMRRVASQLASRLDGESVTEPVRGLQQGLNLFAEPGPSQGQLKADGDPGPKTRAATRRALVQHGTGRVQEMAALGRLHEFAHAWRRRPSTDRHGSGLSKVSEQALAPLYRDPGDKVANEDRVEAMALQDTLNHLGAEPKLKTDGWIGPKTATAFDNVNATLDPEKLVWVLGRRLGIMG